MTDRDTFEQAFVATLYALGRRGDLAVALVEPGAAARGLEARLDKPDQRERARSLAVELRAVVLGLEARRFA